MKTKALNISVKSIEIMSSELEVKIKNFFNLDKIQNLTENQRKSYREWKSIFKELDGLIEERKLNVKSPIFQYFLKKTWEYQKIIFKPYDEKSIAKQRRNVKKFATYLIFSYDQKE